MIKWMDEHFITVKINLDKDRIPLGIKDLTRGVK